MENGLRKQNIFQMSQHSFVQYYILHSHVPSRLRLPKNQCNGAKPTRRVMGSFLFLTRPRARAIETITKHGPFTAWLGPKDVPTGTGPTVPHGCTGVCHHATCCTPATVLPTVIAGCLSTTVGGPADGAQRTQPLFQVNSEHLSLEKKSELLSCFTQLSFLQCFWRVLQERDSLGTVLTITSKTPQ